MSYARFRLWSSVGKKFLTGVTGIALTGFVLVHLLGNLNLFFGSKAFNRYTETLHSLGVLLYVAEIGLIALFVIHISSGLAVWLGKRRGRPIENSVVASKGAPSRPTTSSRTLALTGSVLLLFLVVHVAQFKYGIFGGLEYKTVVDGKEIRDLYRLVAETFANPLWVAFYAAAVGLLGLHFRHGIWSAFQSIGMLTPWLRPIAYSTGAAVALAVALAFLVMPLYLFATGGP